MRRQWVQQITDSMKFQESCLLKPIWGRARAFEGKIIEKASSWKLFSGGSLLDSCVCIIQVYKQEIGLEEFCLQQVTKRMSSIIDDLFFYRQKYRQNRGDSLEQRQEEETFTNLPKKLNLSQEAIVISSNSQFYQLANKLQIQDREYCVRLSIQRKSRSIRIEVRLLKGPFFKRLSSKHTEILLLKQIGKWQFLGCRESTLYVQKGGMVMQQEVHFCLGEKMGRNKITDFYNLVFNRNMNQFNHFVSKHWDSAGNLTIGDLDSQVKLEKDLLLSQVLSTTTTTFDVAEEFSQFKEIERSIQKKRQEIQALKRNIVVEAELEKSVWFLYSAFPQSGRCEWIANNFEHYYASSQKRFSTLLSTSKFSGEKKIDDYIYNTVKVTVKEVMPRPFGEGGSCHIFIAKVLLNYISSVDSTAYFQNEDKKQKILAIKKLKPELEKKFKHKLEHEKEVVSKLKGGCSYFIPKYYRMESMLDPDDTLMMEYIIGDELDFFVMSRQETISLWTKICLLLNVLHGLRYLTNYEIVHLDLKPINILVCRQLITKIIDYGEAYHKDVCDKTYSPGYTFPYVAPEVYLRFQKEPEQREAFEFTEKQDVFAFGLIMAEIIFNSKVYQFTQAKFKEVYGNGQTLERYFFNCGKMLSFGDSRIMATLSHLVIRCIDPDPRKRPKFDWIAVSLKLILNSCTA